MMVSYTNKIYFLPCKPGSVYINVTDKCINKCLFCIKRDGPFFFGSDLSLNGKYPESSEIITSLKNTPHWKEIKEVVFCGMGEPLLRYDCVLETCKKLRSLKKTKFGIRVDTSGLFWANEKRLEILDVVDIISISLNAENSEKYYKLCEPSINDAYEILMSFLYAVKDLENIQHARKHFFPEVRLSIVDTFENKFIPSSGRIGYLEGEIPVPDFEECKKIANHFGWPLVIKRLFRDSRDEKWNTQKVREMCARGISIDACKECTHRH